MPSLAMGLSLRGGLNNAVFRPAQLFTASEPGIWLDPSDLTTLFQDSAGTTPVTAPGDPVGKVLDRSGNGNHASQATAASRPTYGVVPLGGRRNLLTYTERLDNAAWSKARASVTANAVAAPDGTTTADKLVENTDASNIHNAAQTYTAASGTVVALSMYLKAAERSWVRLTANTASGGNASAYFDLTNGAVGSVGGGSATIVNAGGGWWRCTVTGTLTTTNPACSVLLATGNGGQSYTGDGASGVYVWGAQVETGAAATAYQKVVSAFDVTEAGTVSLSYLSFDGVDDFLATGTITPGTDKAQVFAGIRKLSDAARGTVAELSASIATNNGALHLTAPNAASATYAFESKGTVLADAVGTPFAAPRTSVVAGLGDISGDSAIIRVNGAVADTDTGDQGSGNYLAYPIYIGRRGDTSLPFNGRLHGLIARFGPSLNTGQITSAEHWLNAKTGAY
jgi:hypothetical protein